MSALVDMVGGRVREHDESSLYVTWRHPEGRIYPVGLLSRHASNGLETYRFVYLKAAESLAGFPLLPGLRTPDKVYENGDLFPVFRNRQMPRRRPDYGDYLKKLGLTVDSDPFEVMVRNEGRKLTDRIEVFAPPIRTDEGKLATSFFARGIRHREGASEAITELSRGDLLVMADDPHNEVNSRAIFINTRDDKPVGWVPDYFVDTAHELRDLIGEDAISIATEHVNPADVAPYMRLICRLTAPWPDCYEPLSGPQFQPIVS